MCCAHARRSGVSGYRGPAPPVSPAAGPVPLAHVPVAHPPPASHRVICGTAVVLLPCVLVVAPSPPSPRPPVLHHLSHRCDLRHFSITSPSHLHYTSITSVTPSSITSLPSLSDLCHLRHFSITPPSPRSLLHHPCHISVTAVTPPSPLSHFHHLGHSSITSVTPLPPPSHLHHLCYTSITSVTPLSPLHQLTGSGTDTLISRSLLGSIKICVSPLQSQRLFCSLPGGRSGWGGGSARPLTFPAGSAGDADEKQNHYDSGQ